MGKSRDIYVIVILFSSVTIGANVGTMLDPIAPSLLQNRNAGVAAIWGENNAVWLTESG